MAASKAIVVFVYLLAGIPSVAHSAEWTDGDGAWSTASNWDINAVPWIGANSKVDVAIINGSSVTLDVPGPSIGALTIGQGARR
jgi:hypothetical protein